nr:hypothetical protein [Tanacetum cinerariifolium]
MPCMVSYKGDLYKLVLVQIMAASAIAISFDFSDERVGSLPSRVIIFGNIPTVIPSTSVIALEAYAIALVISSAALVVEMAIVTSPIGLCGLVPYSDSNSNSPNKMASLEYITPLPATSPVTTHSSSPSDFLFAPVTTLLRTHRRVAILIRPGEAVPLDHCTSSSSSPMDSSPVYSSGLDAPGQAHSRTSTRVVSPRLSLPSESSSRDSSERPLHSSSHSTRPSGRRCRSLTDYVPSSAPVMGSLAPTRVDLLPPRKRFRDSYSPETNMEEDIEIDTTETEDGREEESEASVEDTVMLGIDPRSVPMVDEEIFDLVGGDSSSSFGTRDGTVWSVEDMPIDLNDAICDFYHHMFEVRVDRIVGIETTQSQLEAHQMIASRERAGMAENVKSLRLENLKIRDDRDDLRRKLRRLDSFVKRRLGFRSYFDSDVIRTMTNTRSEMTPAAIDETINRRMAEALEAHEINRNLRLENLNGNHNGRNGNGNGIGGNRNGNSENGNGNRGNGNGQGGNRNGDGRGDRHNNDLATYTQILQELTMMCTKMVPEEEDQVERFIEGLPDNIQGSIMATEPTILQDAVRMANNMMDKKLKGYDNTGGQNVARAYTTDNNETRGYEGPLPYCNRRQIKGLTRVLSVEHHDTTVRIVPRSRIKTVRTKHGSLRQEEKHIPLEEVTLTRVPTLSRVTVKENKDKSKEKCCRLKIHLFGRSRLIKEQRI